MSKTFGVVLIGVLCVITLRCTTPSNANGNSDEIAAQNSSSDKPRDPAQMVNHYINAPISDPMAWTEAKHVKDLAAFISSYLAEEKKQSRTNPEAVCDRDDRVEIANVDANTPAWEGRGITHLAITMDNGTRVWCSGFYIAPTRVITSAHCLYNNQTKLWASNVIVRPGVFVDKNGTPHIPWLGAIPNYFLVPPEWVNSPVPNPADRIYDYAVMVLAPALFEKANKPC